MPWTDIPILNLFQYFVVFFFDTDIGGVITRSRSNKPICKQLFLSAQRKKTQNFENIIIYTHCNSRKKQFLSAALEDRKNTETHTHINKHKYLH